MLRDAQQDKTARSARAKYIHSSNSSGQQMARPRISVTRWDGLQRIPCHLAIQHCCGAFFRYRNCSRYLFCARRRKAYVSGH